MGLLLARAPVSPGAGEMYTFDSADINQIRNAVFLIGYHMIFLGILCTLSVILILFSTKTQRRRFLLSLQLFSMSIVLAIEIMFVVYMFREIANIIYHRGPDDPAVTSLENLGVVLDTLVVWAPLVSDSVLIYRVYDIHSPALKPRRIQRYLPIIPLLVILVARIGLFGAAVYQDWLSSLNNWDQETGAALFHEWLKLRLAEWVLQIIYCSYAFAMMMRQIIRLTHRSKLLKRSSSSQTRSRLRFFVEALLMTFFIPLVLQIGALISMCIYYTEPDSQTVSTIWNRFTQLNYIFSAIFGILATSWSTIREGSSTMFSRRSRSNESSCDPMVGMEHLKSKGDKSIDADYVVKVEERERRQQSSLLEILFPNNQYDEDDEDVEELRTTQFDTTNRALQMQAQTGSPHTTLYGDTAKPDASRPRSAV
ncbi:hypothetical protein CBS101457_004604 [Exobasidium rhododendri]|nr:hypothetical protein CBS101457_004604 [Exobasidium rhododendri]